MPNRVLMTGATGYIADQILPHLSGPVPARARGCQG